MNNNCRIGKQYHRKDRLMELLFKTTDEINKWPNWKKIIDKRLQEAEEYFKRYKY